MPKQANITIANELKEKVAKAKGLILTDYRGLTHKQSEELHRALKKTDADYVIVKNSLLKIATQDSAYTFNSNEVTGTTAALFSYADEIVSLKELFKFAKTTTLPKVKLGFVSGKKYDALQIESIAKLPGQEILRAHLLGRMSGPLYGLVYNLNGNLQKLVYVLSQVKAVN